MKSSRFEEAWTGGCLLLIFGGILWGVYSVNQWLTNSPPATVSSGPAGKAPAPKPSSPYWKVKNERDTILAASDEKAQSEMLTHANARNTDAIMQMAREGRVLMLKGGTKLLMVDGGFASHTVKVMDGPFAGRECIVATEDIGPE